MRFPTLRARPLPAFRPTFLPALLSTLVVACALSACGGGSGGGGTPVIPVTPTTPTTPTPDAGTQPDMRCAR
jgi:hypothetical protein